MDEIEKLIAEIKEALEVIEADSSDLEFINSEIKKLVKNTPVEMKEVKDG